MSKHTKMSLGGSSYIPSGKEILALEIRECEMEGDRPELGETRDIHDRAMGKGA